MFHRYTTPSYIGGMPSGYDLLNDGGSPVDPHLLVGVGTPTYFVQFGEDGRAGAVNRGLKAVAENTDAIDDFLHGNFAVLASIDIPASTAATIVGTATDPVFVGPPGTPNTQTALEPYFHITDQNNDDIVDATTNTQIVVTGASPGGAVGTFYASTLTLTLNITPSVPYRIWYGTRSSLMEMERGSFIRSSVWGVEHKSASLQQFINNLQSTVAGRGAELVGINTTGFTTATLSTLGGGGLGTAPATVKQAFQATSDRLIQRRSWSAVLTDGTNTVGGDYNGTNIDAALTAMSLGSYFLRYGNYQIANGVAASLLTSMTFVAEVLSGAALALAPTRNLDLTMQGDFRFDGVGLSSLSTSLARFVAAPITASVGFRAVNSLILPGALMATGTAGGFFVLEDCYVGLSTGLGSTNAALEISGELRATLRRCVIDRPNNSKTLYIHDMNNPALSSVLVEDSYFEASANDVHAVQMASVGVPVTFRNCTFNLTATGGVGYAFFAQTGNRLVFDNCVFATANGQALWVDGIDVTFRNCQVIASDVTPGAATSQLVMISTSTGASEIKDLYIYAGASACRGNSGTIQRAIVEIGGKNNVATANGRVRVDGLTLAYSASGSTKAHNFTTLLLHAGTTTISGEVAGGYARVYRNITVDMTSTSVDGTGTLGSAYNHLVSQSPCYVEIGGGDVRTACLVENLKIVSVRNPTADHNRQVLFAQLVTMRGVFIDGTSFSGSFAYTNSLIQIDQCDVRDLYLSRTQPIKCTGLAQVLLTGTTRWKGGEFHARASTSPTVAWILLGDAHCEILDVYVYFSSAVGASTAKVISMPHECCGVLNCQVFIDGTYGAEVVYAPAGSLMGRIIGNRFFWKRAAAQMLLSTDFNTQVLGNIFISDSGVPTISVTGTGSTNTANSIAQITPAPPSPV